MKKLYLLPLAAIALLVCFSRQASAQSFVGYSTGDYSGVHSVLINPANATNQTLKLDINILSLSAFAANDYISLNLSDLTNGGDGFDFSSDSERFPLPNNNIAGNVDLLGPSALFAINGRNSLALTTRVRGFFNVHNVSGDFFELAIGEEDVETFDVDMQDFSGVVHAWSEIGLSYGREVWTTERHAIKAGATLKYIGGAGSVFGFSPQLGAAFNAATNSLTTTGDLSYSYTSEDTDEIGFSNLNSGFGADLGVVYEWRHSYWDTDSPYKLRAGISITDIGAVNYSGTSYFDYDMNETIDAGEFSENGIGDVLEDNYQGVESVGDAKLGLPTAIQLFADYQINHLFYVSAQGAISIKETGLDPVNSIVNTFSITPRFEKRWIGVQSPISVRKYDSSLAWGLGLRLGPLVVGSGSVLTNLISSSSKSVDLYFGFKAPIARK